MATYTTTTYANNQPKAVHVGVNNVSGSYLIALASSVGDTVLLAKLPQGAAITDSWIYASNGATGTGIQVGLQFGGAAGGGASLAAVFTEASTGATRRYSLNGLPPVVSVSDAHPDRFAALVATVQSGTMTTSLQIIFFINYKMDNI